MNKDWKFYRLLAFYKQQEIFTFYYCFYAALRCNKSIMMIIIIDIINSNEVDDFDKHFVIFIHYTCQMW